MFFFLSDGILNARKHRWYMLIQTTVSLKCRCESRLIFQHGPLLLVLKFSIEKCSAMQFKNQYKEMQQQRASCFSVFVVNTDFYH